MRWLACALILVGLAVLLVDGGSRLFGSYARSPGRMLARVSILLFAALLWVTPMGLAFTWPPVPGATVILWATAALSVLLLVHYVFPYRWHIHRDRRVPQLKSRPLTSEVVLREHFVSLPALPAAAEGLRCLILSDLHCNSSRTLGLLETIAERLRSVPVDLLFLLGDFSEFDSLRSDAVHVLARLPARVGRFCVLGNHDYELGRAPRLIRELRALGVHVLEDQAHALPELDITLLGLAHPWLGQPLPSFEPRGFTVCLTHTPDNLRHFRRLGAHVGFAGHTHGGKVVLPGFGALLVPSLLGRFLDRGWFGRAEARLYVTAGLGYFPGRFGRMGEVALVTLTRGEPLPTAAASP